MSVSFYFFFFEGLLGVLLFPKQTLLVSNSSRREHQAVSHSGLLLREHDES